MSGEEGLEYFVLIEVSECESVNNCRRCVSVMFYNMHMLKKKEMMLCASFFSRDVFFVHDDAMFSVVLPKKKEKKPILIVLVDCLCSRLLEVC